MQNGPVPTPRRYGQPSRWPPLLYPRSGPEGVPEPTGWRKWVAVIGVPTLIVGGAFLAVGGVAAFVLALGGL